MNLKRLDLEKFYQEGNAYYQQMGTNAPFGLGGSDLNNSYANDWGL